MKTVHDLTAFCLDYLRETIKRSLHADTDKASTGCIMCAYAAEYVNPYAGGGSVNSAISEYKHLC